jgi:hypothetical protein
MTSTAVLQLTKLFQQVFTLWDRAGFVDLRPADLSFSVDEECRALVHAALVVEHVVGFADRAMRPVIREEGEGDAAELVSPCFQAGNGVGADLQDFDVQLLEFFEVRTEPGDLILSSTRESEWQKRHDSRFAAEARERNLFSIVRGQRKVRRRGAWL